MFGSIKFYMGFNEFHLELSFMYCMEKIPQIWSEKRLLNHQGNCLCNNNVLRMSLTNTHEFSVTDFPCSNWGTNFISQKLAVAERKCRVSNSLGLDTFVESRKNICIRNCSESILLDQQNVSILWTIRADTLRSFWRNQASLYYFER